ncbi:Hypothetical protein PHPALM_15355, partial [Phytophthora palmivora]
MFLAQIRMAAAEKVECQAGILRLIGGDSLKPTRQWVNDELEEPPEEPEVRDGTSLINPVGTEEGDSVDTPQSPKAEDPLERYRKMLKVGVPRPTVEKRMHNDGFNPTELDGHAHGGATHVEHDTDALDVAVATTRRRRWHWSEVPDANRAPPPPNGSIWTEVSEENAHQRISAPSQ